jgi:hypothetical protein
LEVIIPISELDGVTAQQIGETVLAMVPFARLCGAEHIASAYENEEDRKYMRNADIETLQSMVSDELPILEKYRDSEHIRDKQSFDVAISFLREIKDSIDRRSQPAPSARRVIARDYESIFIRIGERDGFRCGACAAVKALQIDHIVPVSCGGDSNDDNLQLLCATCNSRKGTKTIDYRKASADEAQIQAEPDIHAEQSIVSEDMPGVSN